MMTINHFKVGDEVRHMSGRKGRVTEIDKAGVRVDFGEPGLRGIYDNNWFRMYPSGMIYVTGAIATGSWRW